MRSTALLLSLLLVLPASLAAREPAPAAPPFAVPGLTESHLSPAFWIEALPDPDRIVLTPAQIAAQNARMQAEDPSIHDLEALPGRIEGTQVRAWIEGLSKLPERPLHDVHGKPVERGELDRIQASLALDAIPDSQPARHGMVVRRADLRAFPTRLRVFSSAGDTDIDRFQESALFPGDPVAIVHQSADGEWLFIVSQRYAAWIEAQYVAEGERDAIHAWGRRAPFLVVTGATARTAYTPENPGVSDVQLEMGVRVPVRAGWPPMDEVNGQLPAAAHVIELPVRGGDGRLSFEPALLPRSADVASDYLPLTEANLIRQSFKFLGERYGWGHSYNARDCSGFASEIYRSFGVLIPRNTSAQAVSPALNRLPLDKADSHGKRLEALRDARPGDLVYMPGHVMMMIGHVDGEPFVIHDTSGMSWKPEGADDLVRLHLNGVVVTPVAPMMTNATTPTIDRLTSIQRIRP
ncbi:MULTISPECIES: SH3 domain-containing protein [unclassified Luteimonas]|uniref:C40 family peptidase n=1 Tax=unclassified Luteimonas TaxID=2629088 RepID=UPI0018F07AEF|nr:MULTISPECIES: SH3 domain-containing protein [unclassified Luteimonas]MBJ6978072.1 SH3 domain-containing protein [Luteimonas sp. MC1895]MBJ6984181.1 SH3 domain-containing protein [Luteimonas sp. MC1750]QQO07031.1 SH3 domain-containing protein [Luteimonas sp. MC1750]